MYPYDEDKENDKSETNAPVNETSDPQTPSGEDEYHYVRPDAGKSYTDAGYVPQSEATLPPRYYVPEEKPQKPAKEKKPADKHFLKVACLCLCCALLGGAAGGAVTARFMNAAAPAETPVLDNSTATPVPTAPISQVTAGGTANDIYELGCQQVVGITSKLTTTNFFGMTSSGSVSGSGFIITEDGYIMTNYHVVESAYKGGYEVTVMLYSGEKYTAEIVGFDSDNDVAVLKIDASGLNAVTFGNSDSISVGDTVYAIGNPLGELAYTMTSGIVSATDRVISTDESTSINMFQLDAAINSGNSGGPVYNTLGQVVGVVTAKTMQTGVEGLGFAIPINDAITIANELITNGYVTGKAYLGITPQDISASAAQYYNMPQGAYVYSVVEGSCAEKSGLKVSDIITGLDGVDITSSDELRAAVKTHSAGETVDMTIWRGGETMTLSVTFDEAVPQESEAASEPQQSQEQYQYQYPFGYSW